VENHQRGDYNKNGVVDAADYVVWRNTLGQLGANLAADQNSPSLGNADGVVDAYDYNYWSYYFGETPTGAGAGASRVGSVPEPSAFICILVLAALMSARRNSIR
jgi:hypothetical protein